jgi:hypothetical protein
MYRMKESFLQRNEVLLIRFHDPLEVTSGGILRHQREQARHAALVRGIEKPYIVHLAWIGQSEKKSFFEDWDLWLLDNGKCKDNIVWNGW